MKQLILFAVLLFAGFAAGAQAQSLETAQYFDYGIRSMEKSQHEKALEYFNKSLRSAERSQTSPNFRAKIHYNIGVCLYRLDRFADAVGHYDKAITLSDSSYPKASYALSAAREKIKVTPQRNGAARAEARPR